MRFNKILFDLDGTLCDTFDDLCASRNAVLEGYGYKPLGRAENLRDISLVDTEFMRMGLPEEKRNDREFAAEAIRLFRAHQDEHFLDKTHPFEGMREAVEEVIRAGAVTAVLTNKSHDRACTVVEKFFGGLFDTVRGAVPGTFFKPDPRLTAEVLLELGLEHGEDLSSVVLVGDSQIDVQTAKNASIACIAVTWGYRKKELLIADGADFTVDTPRELLDILLKD
ncbi:MAG: HAD family hydrolase [Clostridia bacterium]|nr:HAD family hydrolase [Clostridia bacterium]